MIPQIERQGATTATAPAKAIAGPGDHLGAAYDFLDELGSDAARRHETSKHGTTGPRTGAKSKSAGADEGAEEGEPVAGQVPTPNQAAATPAVKTAGPAEDAVATDVPAAGPSHVPAAATMLAPSAGIRAELSSDVAALDHTAEADIQTAAPQQQQSAGFATGSAAAIDAAQPDPSSSLQPPDFSAQQSTDAGDDLSLSAPRNLAEPAAAAMAGAVSLQNGRPLPPASQRSAYSQAATILMWKAGLNEATGSAPSQVIAAPPAVAAPPVIAGPQTPDAATSAAPLPEVTPGRQNKGDLPEPFIRSMSDASKTKDDPAMTIAAMAASVAALADATPMTTLSGAGAPAIVAPADTASSGGFSGAPALPAPFHPLISSIRSRADARDPASAEPSETELLLNPADLGRIRFALSGTGHHMIVTVAAENPDTLRLLQSHAADLRAELAREGLGQATLSFSGTGMGDTGSQGGRSPPLDAVIDPEMTDRSPVKLDLPPTSLSTQSGGGLDLRL